MNNKYKKFLLMNIFSVLFVVGFVFMKPSYADSNTNLKSDNENSISSEKKLDNSDSISNENEASSDFDTISDENSDKIIEENKNLTSEETKSSSNLEENNDNIDNTNSKEVYEDRSNLKSTYKKDGNFIWTSDGRRRYVYNDGSVPEAGFIEKDNYKYFTYGDGYIYTKQFITFGPSVMYYMDDYGRMSVGKFLDNSNRLRFSNDDGNLINSKGWKINKQGKHYAYNNGYLYTNQFITFGPSVMYYMDNHGRMSIGKFLDNSNNWRFSNDDGNLINSKGWKINKQGKHYAYGNGYLYTNQPITFGSKKMYFMGENGAVSVGKFQDNNKKWRFSNDDGNLINSKGWKINRQGKHYAYGNGYLYTNKLITFGSKIMYFMGDDGRISIGKFLDSSNRWRFSNDDGNLINSKGWKINKQGKHYAYGNGYLYTNQFINFGPKVIYFMGDDGLMKTSKFNYMNIATFNPYSNGLISLSEYRLNKPHIDAMTYANSILRKVGNSLWEAYKWAGTQIKYKTITTNASLGISYFANIGFNQRSGNCYTMASAFYYLARALCYDVHQVSGYHQGYNNIMEHSWCEIRMNGKTYIYDPDVLHEFRKSVYGMAYGQRGTLKYIVSRNVYMHL